MKGKVPWQECVSVTSTAYFYHRELKYRFYFLPAVFSIAPLTIPDYPRLPDWNEIFIHLLAQNLQQCFASLKLALILPIGFDN